MRSRVLIVAVDLETRARLAGMLKRAGYGTEFAEPATRAHVRNNRGVTLAVVVPDGLNAARDTVIGGLRARIGKVLLAGGSAGGCGSGPGMVQAGDEAAVLAGIAALLVDRPDKLAPPPVLRFAAYHLDLGGELLLRDDGAEIRLTNSEFRLLRAFAERPRRVLSRDQLLQAMGSAELGADRGIDMLLVRLRRKIEPDPRSPVLIVTVPGSGYRFNQSVETLAAQTLAAQTLAAMPQAVGEPPSAEAPPAPARRRVTVLCAELAHGVASLPPRDPEVYAEALAAFRRHVEEVARCYGGTAGSSFSRSRSIYFGFIRYCGAPSRELPPSRFASATRAARMIADGHVN